MKRGATKEEIILATQNLIYRNGIRAVRVDEIAQLLGISKRTLYQMFEGKDELINACFLAMSRQQQKRIIACRKRRAPNSLSRAFRLTNEYINGLYSVDCSFLEDIRQRIIFADHFEEHLDFWRNELAQYLECCRREGYLLEEMDATSLAEQVLNTIFELRLNQATSQDALRMFSRTLIRGAATKKGIELIDNKETLLS